MGKRTKQPKESPYQKDTEPNAGVVSEGLVGYFAYGGTSGAFSPSRIVAQLVEGLPFRELERLQANLEVPLEKLAVMLGISKATLNRRKVAGRLDMEESDRVLRFARLVGKAREVFSTEGYAREWLNTPQIGLGGAIPLEFARTEVGAREVEYLLGRIQHGVFS